MTNNISADDPAAGEDRVLRAPVHLLPADGLLTEPRLYRPREYFTVFGQIITDSDLPHATCPDDECDCELRYCPACIQYAIGWNAELEDEMPAPGWTARLGSSSAPGGAPAPSRP